MKKGFTLVELSIVLVIIGLVIGGVLVGQSLISSSKISAQVQQITQFDAGTMAFKSKYKYMPGDAPAFGGNGDGLLGRFTGGITYVDGFSGDVGNFWNNLRPDLYASCTGVCLTAGQQIYTSGSLRNAPLSKIGKNGSYIMTSAYYSGIGSNANTTNPRNFYSIIDPSQGQANVGGRYGAIVTTSENSPVSPIESLALDQKLDDGIANAGNVMAGTRVACGGAGLSCVSTSALATCATATTYVISDNYECTPLIRMGGSAGNPL